MEIIDYQIQKMKRKCRSGANYIRHFFIWVSISMVVGLFGGLVGSLFHIFIEKGTEFRESNPWMIFLLPLAGLLIVFIYRITKTDENLGNNNDAHNGAAALWICYLDKRGAYRGGGAQ